MGELQGDRQDRSSHGFVLGFDAPSGKTFAGLDIDDCIVRGELLPWVRRLLRAFPTYTEISPSGTGIKAFLFGTLPAPLKKTAGIELYAQGRFFTVTGLLGQILGRLGAPGIFTGRHRAPRRRV